ncbi:GntP family permease [Streptomyces sp. 3MP-14]|uniref:GntP family permease n=1 Tax=Streptomyces mimosae TaxID=2586635 RepID=A0A5N6A2Q1_9ACTN|nr:MULTISPECIES: GntP family permease [Streptomyces]KAB8162186.1 GntP family permease [Streptomyces mimosae]KAB8173916.1 GntP family permease [Streptomyces sp. 3MP-14]
MEPETEWVQTLSTGWLLSIAGVAVAALLFLIIVLRMHAFLALITISLGTAFATGIPSEQVLPTLTGGFGDTLANVALLVGLGAILGRLIEVSGGAQSLTDAMIRRFGEERAPLALGVASLIFGFPIFFDAGLVVMLPIVFAVARRLGGGVLRYGLPTAGAFSVMHAFLPPHPGPVAATELLGADLGLVTVFGLLIAVPTWYVTSYLFGLWVGKRVVLPVPELLTGGPRAEEQEEPPRPGTVIALLLLPLVMIFANTGLDAARAAGWVSGEESWFETARALGSTPVALLVAVLVAGHVLGTRRGRGREVVEELTDSALGPVCSIILITGAGGMFGAVLRASGIGDALSESLADLGLPVIVAAFVIASALRIAQGSATVALTTAAGLMQPVVDGGTFSAVALAALVLALAAGSVIASHVNDSGFWLVGRFMNMDVRTTLRTWTVLQTLIAAMGFALACALYAVA